MLLRMTSTQNLPSAKNSLSPPCYEYDSIIHRTTKFCCQNKHQGIKFPACGSIISTKNPSFSENNTSIIHLPSENKTGGRITNHEHALSIFCNPYVRFRPITVIRSVRLPYVRQPQTRETRTINKISTQYVLPGQEPKYDPSIYHPGSTPTMKFLPFTSFSE